MNGMDALDRARRAQAANPKGSIGILTGAATGAAPTASSTERARVKVWDGLVRVFHWSAVLLVVSLVVTAYLGMQDVHMTLGNDLLVLFVARLLWGVMDTGHARFSTFVRGPSTTLAYLRSIARGDPQRHIGHNPAGAAMVIALLATLGGLLASGVLLQATLEFDGPLVDRLRWIDSATVHRLLTAHRFLENALYVLVPLHLAGIALASFQHRENLVQAMITGYKSTNTHER